MVNRVGGPRGGAPLPSGPEPKKTQSRKLRENVSDTKAVAGRVEFIRFQPKNDGFTKGPVNSKAARKEEKVFNKYLPK